MILDNIDFNKKYDYTLILTKKNKKPIAILNGLSDRSLNRMLDGIDKLSFNISYYTENNLTHERVKNPNYDKVMEENMILLKCGEASEPIYEAYFIIKNITESDDKMSKQVECSSRQVMLNKNTVTLNGEEMQLKKDEVNISDGVFDILESETSWKLGTLDQSAKVENIEGINANKYRWFDAISKPWLSFLNDDIQSAFNVILTFDTVNKKINVLNRDSYGKHTGIILSEENYIKNLNKKISSENIVTKLEVTGRDGLDFSEINPYGNTSVFNYDYFRQNGQMSDELMDALDKYDELVNIKNIEFQNLRSQIDSLGASKITKQSEMTQLNEELVALRHIQSSFVSSNDNVNLETATTNVNNKVIEIANKQAELTSIQGEIDGIITQTKTISNDIDKKNAQDSQGNLIFNVELLEELEDFTYVESWENSYYKDPTLLLNGAKEVLKDWSVPTIEFDMDVIDFFGCAKAQKYWDKICLGDLVRVFSSKFNANVDVRIVAYSYNIDSNDLKITFSNKNKKLDDTRGISGVNKKSYEASKVVNVNKLEWNKIKDTKNAVDTFLNNSLDVGRQNVIASNGKNKIDITENGIFVIDADDENHQLAILSGIIGFSSDGWKTCNTALDNSGIYAKFLVGKIILGEQLFIANSDGTVEITGLGMTIKDETGNLKVKVGKLDNGNYGIQIVGKSGNVLLDENGILQSYGFEYADNVDPTHNLKLKFYVPDNVLSVRSLKLAFSVENFRAYERAASSGGGGSTTSASGGGVVNTDTNNLDYSLLPDTVETSVNQLDSDPSYHYHFLTWSSLGHKHPINISSHQHSVSYPNHSHGLDYGIYEDSVAQGVAVIVDGVLRDNTGYDSDQSNIELSQWISTSGWHSIELTSTQLGRINASMFISCFVST